ncbi:MAG: TetR family transcriptional regulator, partial [Solirubrobacteraceae bacterium]|nr:TetR family transcriptional regulator [Solirubrobacteraceae bacterium]
MSDRQGSEATGSSDAPSVSAPPAPKARQARGAEKRAAIVEAAASVALSQGIAAMSHRAVAAAAGVPLGSTTYYFGSLDELRAVAVERLFAGDRDRRAGVIGDGLPTDVGASVLAWALIDLVVGVARLDEPRQVALLYERIAEAARAPELAAVVLDGQESVEADARRLVEGTPWAAVDPGALVALVDGR